jgi:hypothetical protein
MTVVPRMDGQRGITESTRNDSCCINKANACRVKFFQLFFPSAKTFLLSQRVLLPEFLGILSEFKVGRNVQIYSA